jgi:hypothetical protein
MPEYSARLPAARKRIGQTQWVRSVADSLRNKSTLHKLSFIWPRNVSQDGPPDSGIRRECTAKMRLTTSLSISTPKAKATCCAILGHPHVGLRRFIWMTASMSSRVAPLDRVYAGPLERKGGGISDSSVLDGSAKEWRALGPLRNGPNERGGFRNAHNPATNRSDTRKCGARFRERLSITS